jgi:hypothetical protein
MRYGYVNIRPCSLVSLFSVCLWVCDPHKEARHVHLISEWHNLKVKILNKKQIEIRNKIKHKT